MSVNVTKASRARADVEEALKWDLSPVFESLEAFEAAFLTAQTYVDKFAAAQERLQRAGRIRSGRRLLELLRLDQEADKLVERLYYYAHLKSDEDVTISENHARVQRVLQLNSDVSGASSFIKPAIIAIPPGRIEMFLNSTPDLQLYRHFLDNFGRKRPHVRSPEVEALMSQAQVVLGAASTIFRTLSNADLPAKMPMVLAEGGGTVQLSGDVYRVHLESYDREIRRQAWEGMMRTYGDFRRTFASIYSLRVQSGIFQAKVGNFPSVIAMALNSPNLPLSVYDSQVNTVRANLPLLQRYLQLRKRLLKVDDLHMYDLYVPLLEGVDTKISYADAQKTVLESVAILGTDYVEQMRRTYEGRYIDVMPTAGKADGAYCSGISSLHPYMLLNFTGDIGSMFTVAHESGHDGHFEETFRTQPQIYCGHTTFSAEVASTVNEQLLQQHLLNTTTDKKMRLHLLNEQLEKIRLTIVRQTLFAEFEQRAHALAESGKPLTADSLCDIHRQLNNDYYGPTAFVDELVANEWSRIPHFLNPFYVFTYATGMSAALTIANRILTQGQPAVKDYRNFLRSGDSRYSLDLLRDAGADLATSGPAENAFRIFEETLNTLEAEMAILA